MYGFHGKEAMTRGISSAHFIPANLWRRAIPAQTTHVGAGGVTMKCAECGMRIAKIEFPENTINIDKFPKMFMGRTNEILHYDLSGCRNILKWYIR